MTKGSWRSARPPLLQPYCNPLAQSLVHRVRQPVTHAGQHVAVGVQGDTYGGVTQEFLHQFDLPTFAE